VPAAGLKVDFNEFAADASTLGLWHLHRGGSVGGGSGLEDATGGGHPLINLGAIAGEDGYTCVATGNGCLKAPLSGQPARSQLTLECWGRQWQNPADTWGILASYIVSYGTDVELWARRGTTVADSFLGARCIYGGGALVVAAQWTGAPADAVLASPSPFHVAAVLDAPGRLSLYVNGVRRAEANANLTPMPAGTPTIWLGSYNEPGLLHSSVLLDEVRLSGAVRYSADFTPSRLLASGVYASPTFDTLRLGARWTDLVRAELVPAGAAVAWEARAADVLDAAGNPQAAWQPCSDVSPSMPRGRYLQWQATLSAAADRLSSPTAQSAMARASDAGYNLYHATGASPASLTYSDPWRRVGPGIAQVATEGLAPGAVHWFAVRPSDDDGDELPVTQDELRLELDAAGTVTPPRPASPLSVTAQAMVGGAVRLTWRYRIGTSAVAPQAFRLFGDAGSGTINYAAPLAVVPYAAGTSWFAWTSGPLAGGAVHQFAVRAVAADGTWDASPAVASALPDAAPPAPVDALQAGVIL
jgi:hypothetical protein